MSRLTQILSMILGMLVLQASAYAEMTDNHQFPTRTQARQYEFMTHQLRCLVCDNQSIADSDAELAHDLREKVYELVVAEQSNDQIVAYFTDRYGDFVLYRPPFNRMTSLLWAGPVMFVLFGLFTYFARRNKL